MAILNATFVKATNPGGRLFSCVSNEDRYNGEIGVLGELKTDMKNVYEFKKKAANNDVNGYTIGLVMQPEMLYDNSRKSLNKLRDYVTPQGENFTFLPLEEGDKFEVDVDLLRKTGASTDAADGKDLEVGMCYVLENNDTKLHITGQASVVPGGHPQGGLPQEAGRLYFQIVNVKNAHSRLARNNGKDVGTNYKLYTMEVRKKRQ